MEVHPYPFSFFFEEPPTGTCREKIWCVQEQGDSEIKTKSNSNEFYFNEEETKEQKLQLAKFLEEKLDEKIIKKHFA